MKTVNFLLAFMKVHNGALDLQDPLVTFLYDFLDSFDLPKSFYNIS